MGDRIQCALDPRERPMHCHHQKTIVIDDRVAYVGGMSQARSTRTVHFHAQNCPGFVLSNKYPLSIPSFAPRGFNPRLPLS